MVYGYVFLRANLYWLLSAHLGASLKHSFFYAAGGVSFPPMADFARRHDTTVINGRTRVHLIARQFRPMLAEREKPRHLLVRWRGHNLSALARRYMLIFSS